MTADRHRDITKSAARIVLTCLVEMMRPDTLAAIIARYQAMATPLAEEDRADIEAAASWMIHDAAAPLARLLVRGGGTTDIGKMQ